MSNTRTTTRRAPTAAARARTARQSKPPRPVIKFKGSEYKLAEEIGVWPLMQFSAAAESGLTLGEQRGLAALYAMLHDVIHEDDWGRFQQDMITQKTQDLTALMRLANDAVAMLQDELDKKNTSASNGKAITATVEQA